MLHTDEAKLKQYLSNVSFFLFKLFSFCEISLRRSQSIDYYCTELGILDLGWKEIIKTFTNFVRNIIFLCSFFA
jgi:hypothetical protein